ncbi:hypothetical protein K438DRAFT_1010824 [Mycena galopus ATCC 62051]|nr:hypothetical protein K438DRAFT_1010824 [Mycena galopus ATCC 62051]
MPHASLLLVCYASLPIFLAFIFISFTMPPLPIACVLCPPSGYSRKGRSRTNPGSTPFAFLNPNLHCRISSSKPSCVLISSSFVGDHTKLYRVRAAEIGSTRSADFRAAPLVQPRQCASKFGATMRGQSAVLFKALRLVGSLPANCQPSELCSALYMPAVTPFAHNRLILHQQFLVIHTQYVLHNINSRAEGMVESK